MIKYVNIEDINGADKIKKLENGKRFNLSKEFDEHYGEHESLLIINEGIGFRKVEVLENSNKYVCLKVV
ncbi:hypothetical protein N9924_00840 [bacterium]|nr:hypothetical protein [bacterium]